MKIRVMIIRKPKIGLDEALQMLDNRTAALGRLTALGAPKIIVDEQRRMVMEAEQRVIELS